VIASNENTPQSNLILTS